MWREGLESFQQTRQETGSIQDIITSWESKSFKNPIVKKIWDLLPGFTTWSIWKERNGRIFERKTNTSEEIWKRTRTHIKETLGLRPWENSDLKEEQVEAKILSIWEINTVPPYIGPPRPLRNQSQSSEHWSPPPQRIFKLNFDGVAKGNSGLAGIGGVIRNSEGSILGVFWGAIGETTNNMAEIKVLMIGPDMVRTNGWQPTIVEGDSLIIIQMANKILNGKHVHKVANNWCLWEEAMDKLGFGIVSGFPKGHRRSS